jgi:hypothetical protein
MTAVMHASETASVTAWSLRFFLRKERTWRLNLMTKTPYSPWAVSAKLALRRGRRVVGPSRKARQGKQETHTKHADEEVGGDLEIVPVAVVGHLEQDELAGAEWVHGLIVNEGASNAGVERLTASVNVATSAQTKLCHMVFTENV